MLEKLKKEIASFSKEADAGYKEWQDAEAQQVEKEEEYKKVLLKIKEKPTMKLLKKKVELSQELDRLTGLVTLTKQAYYEFVGTYDKGYFMDKLSEVDKKGKIPQEETEAEKNAVNKLNEFLAAYRELQQLENQRVKTHLDVIQPYEVHQNRISEVSPFGNSFSRSLFTSNIRKGKLTSALQLEAGQIATIERERSIYPVLKDIANNS